MNDQATINDLLAIEDAILATSATDPRAELYKMIVSRHCQLTLRIDPVRTTHDLELLLTKALLKWPDLGIGERYSIDLELALDCYKRIERYKLDESSYQIIDHVFEFISTQSSKGSKGQFFTPRYIIDEVVQPLLSDEGPLMVADPACGSGGFLASIASKSNGSSKYFGFDFDPNAVLMARVLATVMGCEISYSQKDSLLKPVGGLFSTNELSIEDFMKVSSPGFQGFDVIATNPPFGGSITNPAMLENYSITDSSKASRDVLFIERCYDLLKPNGRLIIVLPSNVFSEESLGSQRKWILEHFTVTSVLSLHRDSFLPHTHQKTSIIYAKKKAGHHRIEANETIRFSISEKAGKDGRGRVVLKNGQIDTDLREAVGFAGF
jgi:type I restriction enzyme M protein